MASGNQLIQDYATIQNQLGDYFNTITLNVSSISSFGTLGSLGNLITLSPDGGNVDITTLPNLVNLNLNTTGLSYSGSNTLFTTDIDIVDKMLSISLIGSSNKTTITNDTLTTYTLNATDGINAGGQIIGNELRGQTVYTNTIKDSNELTFFTWDSLTGNTSTIATAAHFSTITYDELNPKVSVVIPSAYMSGMDVVSVSSTSPTLINHQLITTDKYGYLHITASVQFENVSNSQEYDMSAYLEITDAGGMVVYYTQVPMTSVINHRIAPATPSTGIIPLTLRSPMVLPPDSYNVAVYAYANDFNGTMTSSRCDINIFSLLQ